MRYTNLAQITDPRQSEDLAVRPPGHVTEVIRELQKWRKNRMRKGLPVQPLDRAIIYLKEYRDICGPLRQARNDHIHKVEG